MIVETDEDPASVTVPGDGATRGPFAVGEDSVTDRLSGGPVEEVTVEFDRPTTGSVQIEPVGGLPAGAPTPEGRVVATVEITPPDDVASRPESVETTVTRSATGGAGAEPSDRGGRSSVPPGSLRPRLVDPRTLPREATTAGGPATRAEGRPSRGG